MFNINRNMFILSHHTIYLLMIWLSLTSAIPFTFAWGIPYHPYKILIFIIAIFMLFKIINRNNIKINELTLMIILFQILFFLFLNYYHDDLYYFNLVIQLFFMSIAYIFIINFIGIKAFSISILNFMYVISIFGIVTFVLIIIFNLQPFHLYFNPDGRVAYSYILSFTNALYQFGDYTLLRLAGYFDEPGTYAFYLMYTLILNKLTINNRKFEVMFILAGVLTFSMAFYMQLILYMIGFYFNKKNLLYGILAFFILILLIIYIDANNGENIFFSQLYELTLGRFELDDNSGNFKGDNRSEQFILAYKLFVEHPFFGNGATFLVESNHYVNAIFLGVFASEGIIGFLFIFLHVIYMYILLFKRTFENKKTFFPYLTISMLLLIQYIQRPYVIGYFTYLIILIIIENLLKSKYEQA